MGKLVITEMPGEGRGCPVCAWMEEGRVAEVLLPPLEQAGVFGNIYVGQVERVLPDIRGAFVRIVSMICRNRSRPSMWAAPMITAGGR